MFMTHIHIFHWPSKNDSLPTAHPNLHTEFTWSVFCFIFNGGEKIMSYIYFKDQLPCNILEPYMKWS